MARREKKKKKWRGVSCCNGSRRALRSYRESVAWAAIRQRHRQRQHNAAAGVAAKAAEKPWHQRARGGMNGALAQQQQRIIAHQIRHQRFASRILRSALTTHNASHHAPWHSRLVYQRSAQTA